MLNYVNVNDQSLLLIGLYGSTNGTHSAFNKSVSCSFSPEYSTTEQQQPILQLTDVDSLPATRNDWSYGGAFHHHHSHRRLNFHSKCDWDVILSLGWPLLGGITELIMVQVVCGSEWLLSTFTAINPLSGQSEHTDQRRVIHLQQLPLYFSTTYSSSAADLIHRLLADQLLVSFRIVCEWY